MKYIILVLIFGLISCQKDSLNTNLSIKYWTDSLNPDAKLHTQLRLAFGKSVANALENVNFRKYIYNLSQNDKDSLYNEILFSTHQNDIVVGNKTFAQFINDNQSDEVRSIFGNTLVEKLLEFDPLVCIKIPDLLYDIKWDPEIFAPCVYVKTPHNLDDRCNYMVYHCSGYQSLINDFEITEPNHYYVTIKYSEDYSLINTNTWQNEKGMSFFEFLPQAEKHWDVLKPLIIASAIPSIYGQDKVYIKKFKAYEIWADNYAYKGPVVVNGSSPCPGYCPRKCVEQMDFVPTIFDHVSVNNELFFHDLGAIFLESGSLYYNFSDQGGKEFNDAVAIPALRFRKLGFKAKSIKLSLVNLSATKISLSPVPFLKLTHYLDHDLPRKNFYIKYLILPKMTSQNIVIYNYFFTYDDYFSNDIWDFESKKVNLHPTWVTVQGSNPYEYCSTPLHEDASNSVSFYINF
ncbi:MAG TPA: hypothetical protein VK590_14630 [Saprospiraceae bacterium]|nr:hypothetical protein [Saprospiraceae bacterium]